MKLCFIFLAYWMYGANCQLLYVNSGVYKFIIGFSVPVNVESPGHGLGWLVNLQGLYRLPDNITYFQPYKVLEKRSMSNYLDRPVIYQAIINQFNRMGLDGKECLSRLICGGGSLGPGNEDGEPSLLATLLRILFTTNTNDEACAYSPNDQLSNRFIQAYYDGFYSTCEK